MNELISIIMPVYNGANHLDFSIMSVVKQSYTNWELIVINDGSTDASASILEQWAATENRIRVFHQLNAGVSAARNLALNQAKGKYILLLDADDYIAPETLTVAHHVISRDLNIDLVLFGFMEIFPHNNEVLHCGALLMGRQDEGHFSCSGHFLAEYMHCSAWAKLMKNSIIHQYQLRFDPTLRIGEDHHFVLRYLQHCNTAAVVQNELYHYMHWEDSAISAFEHASYSHDVYIKAVTIYATLATKLPQKWAFALFAHYLRLYHWVKKIYRQNKPKEWKKVRRTILSHLPSLMWRTGFLDTLRLLRRYSIFSK